MSREGGRKGRPLPLHTPTRPTYDTIGQTFTLIDCVMPPFPSTDPFDAPIPDPDLQVSHLDNGLLVATLPMPWLHEVMVTLQVRAGSQFESEHEEGIAHFLEHMLFKGTGRIPDPTHFHALIEAMAANMNAATGHESNTYWISMPPEQLEPGLEAFCQMFTDPAFTDMETERSVILAEMRDEENEAGESTNTAVLSGHKLWPGHPLSRSILGRPEVISQISRTDLLAYMHRHYRGGNMAIAFCGPIAHAASQQLAQEYLGQLPSGRTPTRDTSLPAMDPGPHWVAVNDQDAQFSLTLSYRAPGYRDPAFYSIAAVRRLLDDGFASRLQAEIREKRGLAYDVWAGYTAYLECGTLELGASVSPDNLDRLFLALLEALEATANAPPSAAEWQRLMVRWRSSLVTQLDRPSLLIDRYVGDRLFDHLEPLSQSWSSIQSLDPQQLPSDLKTLIDAENMVVVLLGPKAKERLPHLRALFKKRSNSLQKRPPKGDASR